MAMQKTRTFCVDGDTVHVELYFGDDSGVWLGDYPFFDEEPRFTPSGRRWKHVSFTDCPYADPQFRDCGTCPHLRKEKQSDLIGVCFNEVLRVELE